MPCQAIRTNIFLAQFTGPNYSRRMDWKRLVGECRLRGVTLEQIKDACGFASRGHVHDVATGKQPKVLWERGDALIRFHRKVMRRKA